MLVQLRMVYPSGSIKHHIIGILPVAIGNKIHMHIVEGCHTERKTIPLNEEKLIDVLVNANHVLLINW